MIEFPSIYLWNNHSNIITNGYRGKYLAVSGKKISVEKVSVCPFFATEQIRCCLNNLRQPILSQYCNPKFPSIIVESWLK